MAIRRRTLVLLALCAAVPTGLTFVLSADASRAPTRAEAGAARVRLTIEPPVVEPGGRLVFRGRGFRRRATVTLLVGPPQSEASPVATARTDGSGRFSRSVRTSTRARPGRYVGLACQRSCRIKAADSFRISTAGIG